MTTQTPSMAKVPDRSAAAARPSARTVLALVLVAVPIAGLALGAHDFALTRLNVPYPDEQGVPLIVRLIGQAVRLGALVALSRCARGFLNARSALTAALIVGAVNAALGETLRVLIIDDQIYGGGGGAPLLYALVDYLPGGLVSFYQGAAAALIARYGARGGPFAVVAATAVAAAVGVCALSPGLKAAMAAWTGSLHLPPATPVYGPPFGFHMYKYIYATFLEPTLASLFLAFMVWPGLAGGGLRRVGLYTVLLLLARGRLFAISINAFWLKFPWPVAVAAEGQFFAETLIMAALTGWAWELASRRRPPAA